VLVFGCFSVNLPIDQNTLKTFTIKQAIFPNRKRKKFLILLKKTLHTEKKAPTT